MFRSIKIVLLITGALFLLPFNSMATIHDFAAGSYVIPMDSCWQPNNDPNTVTNPTQTGCDTNVNDKSIFQAYGLVYAILDRGDDPQNCINNDGSIPFQKRVLGYCKPIKVYWIIDKNKTGPQDPDLQINGTTTPLATIYNSPKTDTGTANPLVYVGGPFVIDANDITDAEMQLFLSAYPEAKVHRINVGFSANVDKILIGKPPKVAVLSEGAVSVLQDYLRASGLFSWENYVFTQVSARDVIDGCLEDPVPATCTKTTSPFQLMWAPHWIVEDKWSDGSTPTVTEQYNVISKIRSFLEKGNAGFYECASIESLEGSQDSKGPRAGNDYDTAKDPNVGGLLVGASNNPPRIDANGGCSDTKGCGTDYLVYEDAPFWLMQCGGWSYEATGGHVHNMRPNESAGYYYLTTKTTDDSATSEDDRFVGTQLKRFIHDDPTKVDYSPSSDYYVYDYLVGGRINGSPTQGYVVYFPGHKYIKCSNTGTSATPERIIDLQFDSPLDPNTVIYFKLVHPYCSTDCPEASFDVGAGHGTTDIDSYVYVDMDSAYYDDTTYTLHNIIIGNKTNGDLSVLDFEVRFDEDNNSPPNIVNNTVNLDSIIDVTSTPSSTICSPVSPSPASCTGSVGIPTNNMSLTFDGDISTDPSTSIVQIEVVHGSCNEGIDCPMVQYDVSTGTQVVSQADGSNKVYLDASSATYSFDASTGEGTLSNVKIGNIDSSCAPVTLKDIVVDFPDNAGSILLTSIDNTTKGNNFCKPNTSSQARCSTAGGGGVTPPPVTPTCPEASYDLSAKKGSSADDRVIKIDMSKSGFDGKGKKLQDITIKNIGCDNMTITDLYLEFPDGGGTLDKFAKFKQDKTDLCDPKPDVDNSPVTPTDCSFSLNIGANGDKKDKFKFEFTHPHNNKGVIKFQIGYTCDDGSSCTVAGGTGGGGTSWSYVLTSPPTCSSSFSYSLGPFTSTCTIDWGSSNTCGIKYVLNTLLALKFQLTSSNFIKTQPIVKDYVIKNSSGQITKLINTVYQASFDYPIYRGHLKKFAREITDLTGTSVPYFTLVWDAATVMPEAGTSGFPSSPDKNLSVRYIFTNEPSTTTKVVFEPSDTNASTLQSYLGATTLNDAKVLINTVRGRVKASTSDVYGSTSDCNNVTPDGNIDLFGCGEDSKRLWAIEHSTPALMTDSTLVDPADEGSSSTNGHRDQIVFVGADDGMLHAFHAGSYDTTQKAYLCNPASPASATNCGTGKEIWAYIPGSLLASLQDQPFNPNPTDYSTFEPAVSVDGSPVLGDLLVNVGTASSPVYEWRTYLIGSAEIRNSSHASVPNGAGILFALDVSNPYSPEILWEGTYADTTATKCEGTDKNCNMGRVKGAAIGSVFMGDELEPVVFVTSNWIDKKNPADPSQDCSTDRTNCVYGVSAYAIDIFSGDVIWQTELPYTGDAVNHQETPAIPALMDIDGNGTMDYVVFGDMQGRVWALSVLNGKSIKGQDSDGFEQPIFEVPEVTDVDNNGNFTVGSTLMGDKEPIGAGVAVKGNYIVFGTGGTDYASNLRKYHLFIIRLLSSGDVTVEYVFEGVTGEKIWAPPLITDDFQIFLATARDYYTRELNPDVSQLKSVGRLITIDIKAKKATVLQIGGKTEIEGGVVGGFDAESGHAYAFKLRPSSNTGGPSFGIIDIGTEFTPNTSTKNPFRVLWWRKL